MSLLFPRNLGSLVSFFAITASANDEIAISESDYLSDIPVVVSATRLPQQINEAPAAITIIDQHMINASGATEIADLFRLVPGFQVYHVGASKFAVTSHGMSNDFPNRLEVMVDGRSIYLPLLSTVDWASIGITLNDIDHIEVIRGSNVPTYGSNAFQGAINIITKSPLGEAGTSIHTLQGSHDTQRYEVRHADTINDISYKVSAGVNETDGFKRPADDALSKHLHYNATYSPSLFDTFDVQLGYSSGDADVGDGDYPDFYHIRDFAANFQFIRWNHIADKDNDFKVQFYRNYLDLDATYLTGQDLLAEIDAQDNNLPRYNSGSVAYGVAAAGLLNATDKLFAADGEDGVTELYDLEFQHIYSGIADIQLLWGAGTRLARAKSDPLLGTLDYIDETTLRLFGNLEWQASPSLLFNLGAMLEHHDQVGDKFSPRAAINYSLSENQTIRAAATLAHRMPSLLELNRYSAYINKADEIIQLTHSSDPDLDSEESKLVELGYHRLFKDIPASIDLRLFREEVNGAIDSWHIILDPNPLTGRKDKVAIPDNVSQWVTKGFETQLTVNPTRQTRIDISYSYANTNGTRNRGYKVDDTFQLIETQDDRNPHHTASLLFSHKFSPGWQFSTATYYMSEVLWFNGDFIDDYLRTDLKLAKELQLKGDLTLTTAVIAQDAFNEQHIEFQDSNQFERRLFLQASLNY
ncbi:MAG: TonB-dependent receptor [Amphritea sp.]